jgi:hypothetical protein
VIPEDPDGLFLYILTMNGGGDAKVLVRENPYSGDTALVSDFTSLADFDIETGLNSTTLLPGDPGSTFLFQGSRRDMNQDSTRDRMFQGKLKHDPSWVTLSRTTGDLPQDSSLFLDLTINTLLENGRDTLPIGRYSAEIEFAFSMNSEKLRLPIELYHGVRNAENQEVFLPGEFQLDPAFPNPFNHSVTIRYELPSGTELLIVIQDVTGREVTRLFDGRALSGRGEVVWDAGTAPSGLYFVKATAGGVGRTGKMILMR